MPKRKSKASKQTTSDDEESGGEISFFDEQDDDLDLNGDQDWVTHDDEDNHDNGYDMNGDDDDQEAGPSKPKEKIGLDPNSQPEKVVTFPKSSLLSQIKNKIRRREMYEKVKKEKKEEKKKVRKTRDELAKALGDKAPAKQVPRTIESTREPDDTMVDPDDEEVKIDESMDEMSSYFSRESEPKVLITSTDNPHTKTIRFCRELKQTIPNSEFRWRNRSSVKKMVTAAIERDYSDIIIINEDWRKPNGMLLIHLPNGPTAHFKMSSVKFCKDIKRRAAYSSHRPEVILNHFNTRLGHTIARMFASVFHFDPQFHGRRVATFHNQRDYIFFRHHRYEFKNEEKVAIQEMGPRFTLKLRSLQHGTFDSKFGEYEWALKRHEMATSRRRFFL